MTALQVAIGALNDVVDAPADAGSKPGKPIPGGVVRRGEAQVIVVGAAAIGLSLAAALGGWLLLALAAVVLAIGVVYDLAAKGTPFSWLPFALGVPLLPIYGWLGTKGAGAEWFTVIWPAGFLAGAALAIANARADLERDLAAGRSSVAAALGLGPSWWVALGLLVVALVVVLLWAPGTLRPPVVAVVLPALGVIGAGVAVGRGTGPDWRERAWQLQAIGVAGVAVGLLWEISRAG
jgi:4-hydroxybenzoate polyprenyltransferase